jgi:hypothetical protein
MLRVTYTGGDAPQRWLFDPDEVDVIEAERIEAELSRGENWDSFIMGLAQSPGVRLRRVLLWHLLRRSNPGYDMPFAEAPRFKMGQLKVELGTAELRRMIEAYEANDKIVPARKAAVVAALEEEFADAAQAEVLLSGDEVTSDPKERPPVAPPAPAAGIPSADDPLPQVGPPADSQPSDPNTSLNSPLF